MSYDRKLLVRTVSPMVLLLLFRPRVPRCLPPKSVALLALLTGCLGVTTARADQRTFVLSPADLVGAPDSFSAKALSRSAILGRSVGLKHGALRFAKGVCPSLLADPTRRITRIRVLGGPAGAPLIVGRSLGSGLTNALALMKAVTWLPPTTGKTRQPNWVAEAPVADAIGFSTLGFAVGNQIGALGKDEGASRIPGFRIDVNLPINPGVGAVDLAVVLTTELPPTKLGKPGKRTECILVASVLPVDLQALRAVTDAAPLTPTTRNLLTGMLNTSQSFLDHGKPDRAARNVRSFVLAVAQRTEAEIPPPVAEQMIIRGNAIAEALSF